MQFLVDLNMRKSWSVATNFKPHAIVLLGDMLDDGRWAMSDDECVISLLR